MEFSAHQNLALTDTMRLRKTWGRAGRAEPHYLDQKKLIEPRTPALPTESFRAEAPQRSSVLILVPAWLSGPPDRTEPWRPACNCPDPLPGTRPRNRRPPHRFVCCPYRIP